MNEIRARVARIFESHLPVDEKNELYPQFIKDRQEGIEKLVATIDGFVISPIKILYIEDGSSYTWLLQVINLLRWFCARFNGPEKESSDSYQEVYDEFLKIRAECWKIINQN